MAKNSHKTVEKKKNPIKNSKPFKKGQSGNPNGRPKKYLSKIIDESGYKESEIRDCIKQILTQKESRIIEISSDDETPILEKLICKGILSDFENGSMNNIELVLNRTYGKPKETIDQNIKGEIKNNIVIVKIPENDRNNI
jgi:hypothetical protein